MELFRDQIIQGDCLVELRKAPADFVDCVFTSSPYWGLRDYGVQNVKVWDGKEDCEHQWVTREYYLHNGRGDAQKSAEFSEQETVPDALKSDAFCSVCGAWKGQLGLEPHPKDFIRHIVQIFHEIQRVLKPQGTCFLNIGDTYFGGGRGQEFTEGDKQATNKGSNSYASIPPAKSDGSNWLRPKQKMLIPERIAIAMQDDGWLLRNAIVWHKINGMPESMADRLKRSYEMVYLFTKEPEYFFNLDAVRRTHTTLDAEMKRKAWKKAVKYSEKKQVGVQRNGRSRSELFNPIGANPGDVWSLTTEPNKSAHLATFPMKLVRRGLLCGCPKEGLVLDPFAGSGTTLYVARKMGLHYIGIEMNPEYIDIIKSRFIKNDFKPIEAGQIQLVPKPKCEQSRLLAYNKLEEK